MDISIIIVNYNVRDLLDNCISSIYKAASDKYSVEIFVVDNNSIDKSADLVKEKYPNVIVIENDKNIGFSKANNIALKEASGKYILILNPDTVLEESTFDKMISFMAKNENTGAVTSKLILTNGKLDSACRRSFPTPSVAIPRMLGLSKLFPKSKAFGKYNLTYLNDDKTYEVDAICGAFMFIPKTVFDKTGYFDEDYFMYGEDLDLCYRIKKAGYRIFYYPEVTTIHFKGESTKKTNLSYVNNFYGAMRIFVRKNFTGYSRLLSGILQFGIIYRSGLSYFIRIFSYLVFPLLDVVILFAAAILSVKLRFNIFPNKQYFFIISVYALIWIFLLTFQGIYSRKNLFSFKKTFYAIIIGFFVNSSITYFFKEYAFSREVILTTTVLGVAGLLSWRFIGRITAFFKSKNILLNKVNLLVVSDSRLKSDVEDNLISKYNIIYYSDIKEKNTIDELQEIIQIKNIHEVIFSGVQFSNLEILNLMWSFRNRNVRFKIVPSDKELILSKLNLNALDNLALIEIEYNINNKLNIFLKRLFDIVVSLVLLVTVYPVLLIMKHILKINLSKYASKLLLLPKVFTGEYSFVGNPIWMDYSNKEFIGKKGLTGLVQLNYYDNITSEELLSYNLFYAKNQSLALDIEILLKTFFSFFKK
ncbi:MAG: glycosyltransferase [Ignavibacteria bacterium]|nr:glycosyltransferase [Ignavibacteria bacterium]